VNADHWISGNSIKMNDRHYGSWTCKWTLWVEKLSSSHRLGRYVFEEIIRDSSTSSLCDTNIFADSMQKKHWILGSRMEIEAPWFLSGGFGYLQCTDLFRSLNFVPITLQDEILIYEYLLNMLYVIFFLYKMRSFSSSSFTFHFIIHASKDRVLRDEFVGFWEEHIGEDLDEIKGYHNHIIHPTTFYS